MNKSIQSRFFSLITAVLIASIIVLGITQSSLYIQHFTEKNEMELQRVVHSIEEGIKAGDIDVQTGDTDSIDYIAEVSSTEVFITDENGKIIFISDFSAMPEELQTNVVSPNIIKSLEETGSFSGLGKLDGAYKSRRYTVAIPITQNEGRPIGFVFANNRVWGFKIYMTDMLSSFIFSAVLAIVLAIILAWVLTKRMVVPIRKISETAKKFGEGDYSARVDIEGNNELEQLAITFNEMANSFEATDTSRRSFMGNIAHELRTPMTTIKGFIDGMLDGTIPEDQRDKYLKIVSEEVGRLARLTHNMLDVSKLEAGEYEINSTDFDIWGPLAQVFINAEKRLEEKQITLEGMDGYPPYIITADKDYVHQILFNLVDNAIKFTGEQGTISVKVEGTKSQVTVEIKNTGDGISEDVLPYVFDRFYKGDASRGINVGGSGLGLHICKVLVGLMGGKMWAESEIGKSASFFFSLPVAVPPKAKAIQIKESPVK